MTEADHGRPKRLPCVPVRRRRILRRDLFRVGDLTVDDPNGSPTVVCLDVVDDVARSRSVYYDQCRIVGWNGNSVRTKHYHLIIKAYGVSIGGYHKSCTELVEMEKESSAKSQAKKLFDRRRTFRGIQSVISKVNPKLLKPGYPWLC
ncbi:hypothetical protein U1Q18_004493 [Sarracenia purpurea var. burkii]